MRLITCAMKNSLIARFGLSVSHSQTDNPNYPNMTKINGKQPEAQFSIQPHEFFCEISRTMRKFFLLCKLPLPLLPVASGLFLYLTFQCCRNMALESFESLCKIY
ncbi:hypothetical protein NPIL_574571 [Nephila pilipes]|uniref:Uncharacterized protein n=1 Tax=Nephila pilipes TaxID=299642 RepID=A0A8X6TIX6_NEPPI|nr:hypothetical protein NPIL_104091 [Nephila pilipes]GFT15444.1 hypothetical protein NPIL_574571 [Nephila pilipes]